MANAFENSGPMPVAILAGGLATRLWPRTEKLPKALVEVAGRPFLEHQLELLRTSGITEIVMCVGFLGEMIEEKYGAGGSLGVHLRYSFDGPGLLGTGGAVRRALPLLPESFFVLYGDSFLPIDYQAVAAAYRRADAPALMTVYRNGDEWDRSNVWFENDRIRLYSKREKSIQMRHIDYGVSVLDQSIFAGTPDIFDLAVRMEELSRAGKLAGHEVYDRFFEIGSPAGLDELDGLIRANAIVNGRIRR